MHSARRVFKYTLAVLAFASAQSALAVTECTVMPTRVHSGDSGNFYIFFSNGGMAIMRKADLDYSATVSVVMFAIATDRSLMVRYAADGVSCSATFQELDGLAMNK